MKILSIGDLLLDVFVHYDPQSGEADTGPDAVKILPGGSAANFAAQAARAGATVRFYSRVGTDWAGEMLVRSLQDDGVLTSVRAINHEPTGRVLVMVDPQGNRRMWSYPGASRTIRVGELEPAWFVGLDAFHLTGYSILRDEPRAAAIKSMEMARDAGVPLCTFDPNPPHLIEDFGPARFRDVVRDLRFDMLFPNLDEGRLLSGKDEPGDIARDLLGISPVVVLKLAGAGCVVATRDGLVQVPAAPTRRVTDATGAGDAFAAAFVVEYGRTRDLHAAALAANALAAQVVSRVGGR